jgi:biopolymer transport protein ExbB
MKRNFPSVLMQLGVMAVLVAAGLAHADDWSTRKPLALDTTPEGVEIKEEVTMIPILVRLHSGNFKFSEAKPDGSDLRAFTPDGKTPLKLHIDSWDVANELASVWVKVPKVAASAKAVAATIAWGNPKANAEGGPEGTYDADQMFVFHFAPEGELTDVTTNRVAVRSTAASVAAGPIGAAAGFDGRATIEIATAPMLSAAKGATFTTWIKQAASDNATLYEQREGAKVLTIGIAAGVPYVSVGAAKVAATAPLRATEWQHLAVVLSATKAKIFVDGISVGSGALQMPDLAGKATIGAGLRGELDEVTLAAVARSDAYVNALASSQSADSALVAFGDDAAEEEGVNYFAILIGAVTIDGWVVIGLLGVMAVVSFYVMISKAILLTRTGKANLAFLQLYQERAANLLDASSDDAKQVAANPEMAGSSVFRLYQIGLKEIAKRVTSAEGKRQPLSDVGSNAVRATLDAAMLRENQKFNSGIVFLTIAIAGGPFLGLLGTVVGVMITFAAIAAAGDVNVNAIAPGIAAALVATVAGLAVAIPALFGYNWLASQIKNASSDGQVFLDEFLTRSAELYSE